MKFIYIKYCYKFLIIFKIIDCKGAIYLIYSRYTYINYIWRRKKFETEINIYNNINKARASIV